VGTTAAPIDPRLGPLQYNGGLTPTMALLAGSPALDAADPALASGTDQRGGDYARVYNGRADIGAFELQPAPHPWPSVSIGSASVVEGNVGTVKLLFTVTLSAPCPDVVVVDYATADGTATAGFDYSAVAGTLTFRPGETSKTIAVTVLSDRVPEPNETFAVNLSNPQMATVASGSGVGTILDDEPRISISDVTKYEGKPGKLTVFVFTVTLSTAYDQPVTMSFRTLDGTAKTGEGDYVGKTGTLTFAPGETTKTITVEVKGDRAKEADETFYLDLFDNSGNSLFTRSRGVGTILNDD
jgi:chitinase